MASLSDIPQRIDQIAENIKKFDSWVQSVNNVNQDAPAGASDDGSEEEVGPVH